MGLDPITLSTPRLNLPPPELPGPLGPIAPDVSSPEGAASPRPSPERAAAGRPRAPHDPAALQVQARAAAMDPARTQEILDRHPAGSPARALIGRAVESPGFGRLDPGSQERMLTLIGGTNDDLASPARKHLASLLDRTAPLDGPAQARQMEKMLRDQPHLPEYVTGSGPTAAAGPARVWPRRIEPRAPFEKGPAPGTSSDLAIDGTTTPVVTPDRSADRRYPAITTPEIGEAMRPLPAATRDAIGSIYSNPRPSRDASGDYEFGAADQDTRRLDLYPGPEARKPGVLAATVAHEGGHILSFARLGRDLDNDAGRAYRDAIRRDRLAPSTYGRSDPHEDFAETFALYTKHRGTPLEREVRELFPARMRVIDWAVQSDPTGLVEHGGYR